MGFASNALNIVGAVLLAHAVYSAYEFSSIPRTSGTISSTSGTTDLPIAAKIYLPLDITIETLISVLLLCVGVVIGAPDLKPIQWRTWAGKLEREKRKDQLSLDRGFVDSPYRALDERVGFLDIRAKRREFADWVKEGGPSAKA